MSQAIVDLRSDTVTKPSPEMRRAMAEAEVGDDVYGEDPTARRLEEEAASLLGFESALFVATGTLGNQIAIRLLAAPGTEVLVEAGSHVYNYELAAMAALSGVQARVLQGEWGRLTPRSVLDAAVPGPYYISRISLLVLENTHNHAGGVVTSLALKRSLLDAARVRNLATHLDGARIFNAAVALGIPPRDLAHGFDTVMFCLSKGLGAPAGSILCSSRERIQEARVVRKRFGGGMRQVGVLAAAGRVAMQRHLERLVEDHRRARRLAQALAESRVFRIDPARVETNIVVADVAEGFTVEAILQALKERGILAGAMGAGRVRFVTHLDVDDDGVEKACQAVSNL